MASGDDRSTSNSWIWSNTSHRRYNPLSDTWVLVSPHRATRPWSGQQESVASAPSCAYDPDCYLCPGNRRAQGQQNPRYTGAYTFVNDFSALTLDAPAEHLSEPLFQARTERGVCKVICYSPRHDLTMAELDVAAIEQVVSVWQQEYRELGALDFVRHVQIFENKGAVMGCSNPHPHGQIWAQESIPHDVQREHEQQRVYWQKHSRTLLQDCLEQELQRQERIVLISAHFVVWVPFWAMWPFEVIVVPRASAPDIGHMSAVQMVDFAEVLKRLTSKYDNLFQTSFPYSAGIHQAPTDGGDHRHWCWHMHFYPPLLRSATVKKFMVGYEMFAEPQRDLTPERCAAILRELPEIHYKRDSSDTF